MKDDNTTIIHCNVSQYQLVALWLHIYIRDLIKQPHTIMHTNASNFCTRSSSTTQEIQGGSNLTPKDTPLHMIQGSIHSDVMVYGVNKSVVYGYGSPLPRVEMSAVWRQLLCIEILLASRPRPGHGQILPVYVDCGHVGHSQLQTFFVKSVLQDSNYEVYVVKCQLCHIIYIDMSLS